MWLSRQRVSIPRAGICYWYGKAVRPSCIMMFTFLSPVSLRWGATLQPDNCHRLGFFSSANGCGKRAQASLKLVWSASFALGFRLQFSSMPGCVQSFISKKMSYVNYLALLLLYIFSAEKVPASVVMANEQAVEFLSSIGELFNESFCLFWSLQKRSYELTTEQLVLFWRSSCLLWVLPVIQIAFSLRRIE